MGKFVLKSIGLINPTILEYHADCGIIKAITSKELSVYQLVDFWKKQFPEFSDWGWQTIYTSQENINSMAKKPMPSSKSLEQFFCDKGVIFKSIKEDTI